MSSLPRTLHPPEEQNTSRAGRMTGRENSSKRECQGGIRVRRRMSAPSSPSLVVARAPGGRQVDRVWGNGERGEWRDPLVWLGLSAHPPLDC